MDNGTDTNPGMFGHRGFGSSENNVKDLPVGRFRSSGTIFFCTNRAANASHREKGFQRVKEEDGTFIPQDVPMKSFEQAREAGKHTKIH